MRNPFRNREMLRVYNGAIKTYEARHKNLFLSNGERRRSPNYGSSFAASFWNGYDGIGADRWDKVSRTWAAYAVWRAGRDIRRDEDEKAEIYRVLRNIRTLAAG
jgi:hypothetical protein